MNAPTIKYGLITIILVFLRGAECKAQTETKFFNKQNLTGWFASDMRYWSVENGVIIGVTHEKLNKNQFLWSKVKVTDFYLDVDVFLDPNDRNAGIQFRSQKADSTGQALGYQADMGKDVWGRLYHEHGRGKLYWGDRGEAAVKTGQWNKYEILAVGDQIWTAINGKLAVAVKDPGGDRSGYIALQIHSGDAQKVKYKINKLIHNPKVSLAGLNAAQLKKELKFPLDKAQGNLSPMKFNEGDVVVFAGGSNIANMRKDGYLETLLTAANSTAKLHIWNLGWDGDTVYEQFRDVGFGKWSANLDSLQADVALIQFGQMEALDGEDKIPQFLKAYKALLGQIEKPGRRIILISPIPFEPNRINSGGANSTNNPLAGKSIEKYTEGIKQMANQEGYQFVNLYDLMRKSSLAGSLTTDGIHLTQEAQLLSANLIMQELGMPGTFSKKLEGMRQEILNKNLLWIGYWRPGNWAFLGGDRTAVPFSRDWKDTEKRIFPEEMKSFEPLIREAENRISRERCLLMSQK